jgi:hypothetical protein
LWKVWFGYFDFGVSLLWRLLLGALERFFKNFLQGLVLEMLPFPMIYNSYIVLHYFTIYSAFLKVCINNDAAFIYLASCFLTWQVKILNYSPFGECLGKNNLSTPLHAEVKFLILCNHAFETDFWFFCATTRFYKSYDWGEALMTLSSKKGMQIVSGVSKQGF